MSSDLPDPKAMFLRFLNDSGDEAAARTRFQRLVTDLVLVQMPTASEVGYPGGGDWGIDTYVGSLDKEIVVWQSKFFMDWGESQKKQIRESFDQVVDKAKQQNFKVSAWTLCVPSVLPPDQEKWFHGWKGRKTRETNVEIALWNGVHLRHKLQQEDASAIRSLYFPDQLSMGTDLPLAKLPTVTTLSEALFVRQLESAGHAETDAAKGFFFAAEAMARDVQGRGVPAETSALYEAELEAHGVWEQTFNDKLRIASADGRMAGLFNEVNNSVAQLALPQGLGLRRAHWRGLVHRHVEGRRAGWVKHWRDIADAYTGLPAGTVLEQSGQLSSPGEGTDGVGREA